MDERERIEQVIKHADMNARQFASVIDINGSTLSHVLSGRNNPSLDIMQKVLNAFPDISSEWLILGKGSMWRQKNNSQQPTLFDSEEQNTLEPITSVQKTEEKNETKNESIHTKQEESPLIEQNSSITPPEQAEKIQSSPIIIQNIPAQKSIAKIIVYFSDNTFQEF